MNRESVNRMWKLDCMVRGPEMNLGDQVNTRKR